MAAAIREKKKTVDNVYLKGGVKQINHNTLISDVCEKVQINLCSAGLKVAVSLVYSKKCLMYL